MHLFYSPSTLTNNVYSRPEMFYLLHFCGLEWGHFPPESIEWFIEDQAFSLLYDVAPIPTQWYVYTRWGTDMGLYMIVGHWMNIWPQNSKGDQLNVWTVFVVLFSTLQLKFEPDSPAISIRGWKVKSEANVMVWLKMPDISQLAGRVGGGEGGVWQNLLISLN